ncbi:uncharacterized protein MELLADRAFT_108269 [Melampsora larici-populina 98AG31]|uniref:Secreted protein n=1 Tax=Melampsora larici-populina (strain 98AG31 / pathotype 3-4-7) TaxID=747676 RepID=F4RSJ0_MELLP|nr:uncharacterized protein MELLADRAFT_108269 [Melampsora larici-populina 98AG31]EGG04687.1 secreted protein [Melampsora larici-populina 98AG31]
MLTVHRFFALVFIYSSVMRYGEALHCNSVPESTPINRDQCIKAFINLKQVDDRISHGIKVYSKTPGCQLVLETFNYGKVYPERRVARTALNTVLEGCPGHAGSILIDNGSRYPNGNNSLCLTVLYTNVTTDQIQEF